MSKRESTHLSFRKIRPLFQELGFNRFQREVEQLAAGAEVTSAPKTGERETRGDRVAVLAEQTTAILEKGEYETADSGDYSVITTPEQLESLAATLRTQPIISVDTETTSLERDAALCGLSFSWKSGHGVYVPIRSPNPGDHLDAETVLTALGPIFVGQQSVQVRSQLEVRRAGVAAKRRTTARCCVRLNACQFAY